ncbi:S-layer homology domain-containing protein [Paenibacillus sp. MMS18-CY102]|uniref:S-layer homology domain-containing protein n=1 Tax=Paenibacillus sp. MMS18-CY102 TaxID=2682849 RepID=UPI0013666FB7|nr:S-layer homology domain-containing protein [Paenibacillus sp. MMS18-CY102]MWC28833.1 hypothetical protein [Paenibacillus sp. MMS18-CY102]
MKKLKKMISTLSVASVVASSLCLVAPAAASAATGANNSIFGPNVFVFDQSMSTSDIESDANAVFDIQEDNQFGNDRYALLFKPGTYDVDVKAGFYTQVSGLGQNPDDVLITGSANVDAQWWGGNATLNFWRSFENFAIDPVGNDTKYAVAQAAPMRRMHIKSNMLLFDFDPWWNAGWGSGGFLADSIIDNQIIPASQQQWFSRNNQYGSWSNGVWNMVFVGDSAPPSGTFPQEPYTVVDESPVIREKPYLYIDSNGEYQVFVPDKQTNAKGVSWANGSTPGHSVSINDFYIAQPGTSDAASINAALSSGKNVIFTPGIFHTDDTIRITNPDTIVLGLGMATIIPDNGQIGMTIADVDGVKVAGLLFDAGPQNSPSLLEVGPAGSSLDHAANPTSLHDLFFRVGGDILGLADNVMTINSDDVIGDHFWIWRADHGASVTWGTSSKTGLIVNGDDITMYGLFNEHHSEYQTLWNGERGRTYFYQSEIPYDPPAQADWMSNNGTVNGYASYKVADGVTTHEAWGLGIYSYFRDAAVKLESAIEVPNVPGIKIHHATTIFLSGMAGSEITHIVNQNGGRVYANSPESAMRQTLTEFVGGDAVAPSVPANLSAAAISNSKIELNWTASTDNVGVEGYDIYRNGVLVGYSGTTSYQDGGLSSSTAYTYTVRAKDAASNTSADSNTASATTQSNGGKVDRIGWTATTSTGSNDPYSNLFDDNLNSRWSAGTTMVPGQSLTIDMQAANDITRVVMDSSNSANDYARGYEIYASADGTNWGSAIASGTGTGAVISVDAVAQNVRYIKIVQTGTSGSWWSINEIYVYGTPSVVTPSDTTPPETTIDSSPAAVSNSATATFTFSSNESGTFEASLDGAAFAASTSPLTLTGLADGSHTLQVRAIDAAGNVDATPASYTWTIDTAVTPPQDTTAPETTIDSGPAAVSNSATATFTFSSNESGTFEASLDGAAFTASTSPLTLTGLADGSHTLQVRAIDAAGNVDATPASYTWTIDTAVTPPQDTTAPETTIDSSPAAVSNSATATFTFSSNESGTFEASLDGAAFAASTNPLTLAGLADGSHTLQVRAIDAAGNVDATPASYTWTVETVPPVVSSGGGANLSDNADLQSLELQADGKSLAITPAFQANVTSYTAATEAAQVQVAVKTAHAGATATLAVNGQPISDGKAALKEGDNSLVITVRSAIGLTKSYTVKIHRSAAPTTTTPITFSDLTGHWAEQQILSAAQQKLVSGYPDGTFQPDHTITRAEFTFMLMNALHPEAKGAELAFADKDAIGTWAQAAIAAAVQAGIVQGYADGSFQPNATITRAEMAAMVTRALGITSSAEAAGFSDQAAIPQWAQGAIDVLQAEGFIQGRSDNRFEPNAETTRAEATVLLLRILQK